MIPRELMGSTQVPGGGEMRLVRRGQDWFIMLGAEELMSSRMSTSEIALGTIACERLHTPSPRVLIGGYGMGFTLRAVLGAVGPRAEVVVAELVSAVIEWARGPMAETTGGCLDDPRVTIAERDVAAVILEHPRGFDAILLDVDNGPDGLTRAGNDRLYSAAGLAAARAALRSGGVLAIWSAAPDQRFAKRLENSGFAVDEVTVRARASGKGSRHVIWFATRAR